jgi:RNA polymerase sigma factor (sigma-70 family)
MIPAEIVYPGDSPESPDLGDRNRALAAALSQERDRIVRFCARFTGSPDSAEDLAQETLIEAWRHAYKLRTLEGVTSWTLAIARNVCLRWRQRQQRPIVRLTRTLQTELDDPATEDWDLQVALERQELADLLDRALGQLPPRTRTTLVEKYIHERSQSEIAERLGVSEGAVELRLRRGKLALRRLLTTTLQPEASAYGVSHMMVEESWNETRIWCPRCGRRRLRARLTQGHRAFLLDCPSCCSEELPLGHWEDPEAICGLKGYKPILTRLSTLDHLYYRQGLRDGIARCRTCGTLTPVERSVPYDLAERFGTTLGLVVRCHACDVTRFASAEALVCSLPEFRRFWREHPRVRRVAPQQVEAEGQLATITQIESLTDAATLTVVWAQQSYQVLRIYGGDGGDAG